MYDIYMWLYNLIFYLFSIVFPCQHHCFIKKVYDKCLPTFCTEIQFFHTRQWIFMIVTLTPEKAYSYYRSVNLTRELYHSIMTKPYTGNTGRIYHTLWLKLDVIFNNHNWTRFISNRREEYASLTTVCTIWPRRQGSLVLPWKFKRWRPHFRQHLYSYFLMDFEEPIAIFFLTTSGYFKRYTMEEG